MDTTLFLSHIWAPKPEYLSTRRLLDLRNPVPAYLLLVDAVEKTCAVDHSRQG